MTTLASQGLLTTAFYLRRLERARNRFHDHVERGAAVPADLQTELAFAESALAHFALGLLSPELRDARQALRTSSRRTVQQASR